MFVIIFCFVNSKKNLFFLKCLWLLKYLIVYFIYELFFQKYSRWISHFRYPDSSPIRTIWHGNKSVLISESPLYIIFLKKKFCNSSRSAMSLSRSKYVINPLFVFITAGLNNPCSYKDSPWFPLNLLYFPHHIYVRFNPFTVSDCSQNCNIVRYLFINLTLFILLFRSHVVMFLF